MRLNNYMRNYAALLSKSNKSLYSLGYNNLNSRRNLNVSRETSDFIKNDIDLIDQRNSCLTENYYQI